MTISSTPRSAAFAEEDHPRDERGRFGDKGGDTQAKSSPLAPRPKVMDDLTDADRAAIAKGEQRIRDAIGQGKDVDLSKLSPALAPLLAQSVERTVAEFPAVARNLNSIEVVPIGGGILGQYQPSTGAMQLNENTFGQFQIFHSEMEMARNGRLDTSMNEKGSFHPLDDAQSTFDHEIGHAVWKTATDEMIGQQIATHDMRTQGNVAYWRGMSNKDISARFLGFDPDADRARAMDEDRKLAYPSTRTITSGLRAMGSEYGAKSYLRREWDEPTHDLNEGFAEWFSVRQRPEMSPMLTARTNDLLSNGFNRVLDFTRDAATAGQPGRAAAARPVTIPDAMPSSTSPTCYGYVSGAQWKAMSKAERDALFPPPEAEVILAAAIEVAGDYGLDLIDGVLRTESGAIFPPDTLVTIVHARLAYSEDQKRDDRGRFGEGDGGTVDSAGGHVPGEKQDGTAVKFPKGTTLYRSVNADLRGALVPSRMGESGPGVYLTTNRAFAEQMTANMPGRELYEVTTGRALRLLDRTAPGGDDEYRALQDASSAINRDGALAKAITDAGYDGVRFAGVNKGDAEVTVLDASALDGKPVQPRTAAFDESQHPRDDRGRFGEGDGGHADKADTHFTTAADVPLVAWAQQFPKGTVFRSGNPSRLDAMRHGEDLGTPDPTGARGETYGEERIGGIWVSTTAKPEYLDKGEQLAAFDPSASKVVNEGAPGDMLLDYVPADHLLGTWTPGPAGARGYDVTPPQARGRGMIRGIAPVGKAVTAAFDESKHPREKGRFTFKEDGEIAPEKPRPQDEVAPAPIPRDANGKLDVDALLAANPQKPDEDIFVYQGRVAHLLDDSQEQSDLLFAVRERYEPVQSVVDGMQQWQVDHGLDPVPAVIVEQHADLAEADAAGRAFENATDQSGDPTVQAAYEDFKRQNEEMFDYMTKPVAEGGMGINVQFTNQHDPYKTAAAQAADLRDNNRIVIESGLGGNHTASMTTAEYDRFRAVHDTFGHAAIGGGFDRHGEYEAWLTHSMMYTDPGRLAMSTEYHGVNSAMWSGNPSDPGGTGKTVLLGEYAEPPWERTHAAAVQAAVAPWITPPEIRELIERVGFDANFANHFMPCRWHYDELPMQAAFDESQHPRDEHGRFVSDAPLVLARQRQPKDTKPGSAPARNAEILTLADLTPAQQAKVMDKVTGPIPPVKPEGGWPKDANGEKMIPQPPEGEAWGIDATPEEVRANYEAMFERGMADPENRDAGMHWYENTRDQAIELGDKYGYDLTESATAIAAMSAGTRWETEFPILETMMRMDGTELDVSQERLDAINTKLTGLDADGNRVSKGLGEDPVSNGMNISDMNSAQAIQVMFNEHMTQPSAPDRIYDTKDGWGARYSFNQYERSLEAIRDELPPEQMNGVKVREFYDNITHPEVDGHVTIDVMMMQIASNDTRVQNETRITGAPSIDSVALGPSPFLADEVRRIAAAHDPPVLAQQAQAVMWVQWLDEQKAAGRGGARGGADV